MGLAEGQRVAINVPRVKRGQKPSVCGLSEAPGALLSGELRWKTDLRHCCPSD